MKYLEYLSKGGFKALILTVMAKDFDFISKSSFILCDN